MNIDFTIQSLRFQSGSLNIRYETRCSKLPEIPFVSQSVMSKASRPSSSPRKSKNGSILLLEPIDFETQMVNVELRNPNNLLSK